MTIQQYQTFLTSVWVPTIGAAALATGVSSAGGFAAVTVVALLPPIVMRVLWREPAPSTSESIRNALR